MVIKRVEKPSESAICIEKMAVLPLRQLVDVRAHTMVHGAPLGVELFRRHQLADAPVQLQARLPIVLGQGEFADVGVFPPGRRNARLSGQLVVPLLDIAQQLQRTAALHREVGLRWIVMLDRATGCGDLLWNVLLMLDVVDDGTDQCRVQHRVFD